MSVLANAIYAILRTLVPAATAKITYEDLVSQLGPMPPPSQNLQAYDNRLFVALGEIVTRCQQLGLRMIPAIVVRKDEQTPGDGYYPIAHPMNPRDTVQEMIAWGNEVTEVRRRTYPPTI